MRLLLLLFPLLCTADPCLNPLSLTCWEYRMGMGRMWGMDIGTNPPHTCTGSHICYKVPNTTDPCNALKSKRILFCGDSYVRHAYEGLALLLSGDYETGAIKNDPACTGEALFGEKDCQLKVPPHFEICGVRIELRYNAQLNIDDHTKSSKLEYPPFTHASCPSCKCRCTRSTPWKRTCGIRPARKIVQYPRPKPTSSTFERVPAFS